MIFSYRRHTDVLEFELHNHLIIMSFRGTKSPKPVVKPGVAQDFFYYCMRSVQRTMSTAAFFKSPILLKFRLITYSLPVRLNNVVSLIKTANDKERRNFYIIKNPLHYAQAPFAPIY